VRDNPTNCVGCGDNRVIVLLGRVVRTLGAAGSDGSLCCRAAFGLRSAVFVALAERGAAGGCTARRTVRRAASDEAIGEELRGGFGAVHVCRAMVHAVFMEHAGAHLAALTASRRGDVQATLEELPRLGLALCLRKTIAHAVVEQPAGDEVAAFRAIERRAGGEAMMNERAGAFVAHVLGLAGGETLTAGFRAGEFAAVAAGALLAFEHAAFAGAVGATLAFIGVTACGQAGLQNVVGAGIARGDAPALARRLGGVVGVDGSEVHYGHHRGDGVTVRVGSEGERGGKQCNDECRNSPSDHMSRANEIERGLHDGTSLLGLGD